MKLSRDFRARAITCSPLILHRLGSDNRLEERDGLRLPLNAQLKLLPLQAVYEMPLLVQHGHVRLHQLRVDTNDILCLARRIFLRLVLRLRECEGRDAAGGECGGQQETESCGLQRAHIRTTFQRNFVERLSETMLSYSTMKLALCDALAFVARSVAVTCSAYRPGGS